MKSVVLSVPFARPALMVSRAVGTLVRVFDAWRNRREIAALSHLDDHMLKDIGVTRVDIQSVLAEPISCDPSYALASRVRDKQTGDRATARERLRVVRLMKPER